MTKLEQPGLDPYLESADASTTRTGKVGFSRTVSILLASVFLVLSSAACNLTADAQQTPTIALPTALPPFGTGTAPGAANTPLLLPTIPTLAPAAGVTVVAPTVLPNASGNTSGGSAGTGGTGATILPRGSTGGTGSTNGSTGAGCTPRSDWVPYVVKAGDSLSLLAASANSTVADLVAGNCLPNPDQIDVGQTIYLPSATITATPATGTGNTGRNVHGSADLASAGGPLITSLKLNPASANPSLSPYDFVVRAGAEVILQAEGVAGATNVIFYATESGVGTITLGSVDSALSASSSPSNPPIGPQNDAWLIHWNVPDQPGAVLYLVATAEDVYGSMAHTPVLRIQVAA